MKKLPYIWFDHRTDLPQWLLNGIGGIVVEWSALERELEELIRLLLDVDLQPSRIVTSGMRVRTRILIITGFLQAHTYNNKLPEKHLKSFVKLAKEIDRLEGERNKVVHGLWTRIKREWYVLRIPGSRVIQPLKPEINSMLRAVLPQREKIPPSKIEGIIHNIVSAAQALEATANPLGAALSPLQSKSPEYTRRRPRSHARKNKAPPTQRPS